ncbi:Unknown protein [Striga hermonthica]|uniref:Uncharacterized protein n=1 Tax=Striga hermonthica TaxID=68872 RepID=A0A9N7N3E1_STRHE|nr:Unknown protein [Striga hermonthica]
MCLTIWALLNDEAQSAMLWAGPWSMLLVIATGSGFVRSKWRSRIGMRAVDFLKRAIELEASKVAIFMVVQGLVYLILSQSSNVFSKTRKSNSFKMARTISIRRWAAALADIPAGGEQSPAPRDFLRALSLKDSN